MMAIRQPIRTLIVSVIAATTIAACTLGDFYLQATLLTVHERNDRFRGDEPYLGVIRWQGVFDTPGSVEVEVFDELVTLGSQVRPGRSVAIPAEIGMVDFGTVGILNQADIDRGDNPGVGGVIYVAMEEDRVGKDVVRATLANIASELESVLVEQLENQAWSTSALPLTLQAVDERLSSTDGNEGCGLLNTRLCRFVRGRLGDDFIGQAALIYVGLEPEAFDALAPQWQAIADLFGSNWPACNDNQIALCAPSTRGRTHSLEFNGEDAQWSLDVFTRFSG